MAVLGALENVLLKIVKTASDVVDCFYVLPAMPVRFKLFLLMNSPNQFKLSFSVLLVTRKKLGNTTSSIPFLTKNKMLYILKNLQSDNTFLTIIKKKISLKRRSMIGLKIKP